MWRCESRSHFRWATRPQFVTFSLSVCPLQHDKASDDSNYAHVESFPQFYISYIFSSVYFRSMCHLLTCWRGGTWPARSPNSIFDQRNFGGKITPPNGRYAPNTYRHHGGRCRSPQSKIQQLTMIVLYCGVLSFYWSRSARLIVVFCWSTRTSCSWPSSCSFCVSYFRFCDCFADQRAKYWIFEKILHTNP